MDIEKWLSDIIAPDSRRTAAAKIGLNDSTISRQLSRWHTLSPEVVIALCRTYGHQPVDGLMETGHLNEDEVNGVGVEKALAMATNEQLLKEIMARVDPEATRAFHGNEGEITPHFSDNVAHLPAREEYEEPERYVAKKRNRELSEGDDGYGSGA